MDGATEKERRGRDGVPESPAAGEAPSIVAEVAQFEMHMQAMQSQVTSFERGQARLAAQVEGWGNILTGITPTIDPLATAATCVRVRRATIGRTAAGM